ncbi:MAG: PAS domain S-box protein [Planctomycetota bacterium]
MLQQITTTSDQAADGIVLIDGGGTLCLANLAWAATHGHDNPDELIGKRVSAFHTEEQNTFMRDFVEEATRRGRLAGPVDRVLSDGTVFCSQARIGGHNG